MKALIASTDGIASAQLGAATNMDADVLANSSTC